MWYEKSGLQLNNTFLFESHTLIWEKFLIHVDYYSNLIFVSQKSNELHKSMYKHAHIRFHIFGGEKKDKKT